SRAISACCTCATGTGRRAGRVGTGRNASWGCRRCTGGGAPTGGFDSPAAARGRAADRRPRTIGRHPPLGERRSRGRRPGAGRRGRAGDGVFVGLKRPSHAHTHTEHVEVVAGDDETSRALRYPVAQRQPHIVEGRDAGEQIGSLTTGEVCRVRETAWTRPLLA